MVGAVRLKRLAAVGSRHLLPIDEGDNMADWSQVSANGEDSQLALLTELTLNISCLIKLEEGTLQE